MKKNIYILIVILILLIFVGGWWFINNTSKPGDLNDEESITSDITLDQDTDLDEEDEPEPEVKTKREKVIGQSVEGRDITAYIYGNSDTKLLFIGGIHGGYSWNSSLVAFELMDYLENNLPEKVEVSVIPVLNPDGLHKVAGTAGRFSSKDIPTDSAQTIPGRFNANGVDLGRNFDCNWQTESTWQSRTVDAGTAVFSEPEAKALRDYVRNYEPKAVVAWYSAGGGVFASSCSDNVSTATMALTDLYAEASGYEAFESFDYYKITGDPLNWMAKIGIPAISVLLQTHSDVEWQQNKRGIEAMLEYYSELN
ncbi:MAG: M14 family zinc carboxypeptidase [Patescibacteria group bacterium]